MSGVCCEPFVGYRVWSYKLLGRGGVGLRGGSLAVETQRWMGDVWNAGTLPRGVLGRKHYSPDSLPSFQQHSRADLQSSPCFWGSPQLAFLYDTLARGYCMLGRMGSVSDLGQLKIVCQHGLNFLTKAGARLTYCYRRGESKYCW